MPSSVLASDECEAEEGPSEVLSPSMCDDVCVDALSYADPDLFLLAGRYTLLDQSALPELLPRCVARGVRIVVGGPFNSGILASGTRPADGRALYFNYAPAPPDIVARVAAVESVCGQFAVPLQAAALQFPAAHPAVMLFLGDARQSRSLRQGADLSG